MYVNVRLAFTSTISVRVWLSLSHRMPPTTDKINEAAKQRWDTVRMEPCDGTNFREVWDTISAELELRGAHHLL
jgi:hypothetical protein